MGHSETDHFNNAVMRTIQHEGGYVDDAHDRGGATKYGISRRAYPDLDIANLSMAHAVAIYREDYWEKPGIWRIKHPDLAARLFDLGVNCGPGAAVRMLQRACNLLRAGGSLVVDGLLGPVTAAAVNEYDHPRALLAALKYQAAGHYISLDQPRFLAGWLGRLES
ncbi:glycoside hydrolase family 108 protein [Geoalkalibacter subterraneus]|uniref:glycoside hydrolase family 108 protein n=1 Tax=Geoalkalibacter subterraneus TaxID=483547 RepID=UPI0006937C19|nr:glycosyl hydrolase 108 family protein [Geoalkalibacter subterraneus]